MQPCEPVDQRDEVIGQKPYAGRLHRVCGRQSVARARLLRQLANQSVDNGRGQSRTDTVATEIWRGSVGVLALLLGTSRAVSRELNWDWWISMVGF